MIEVLIHSLELMLLVLAGYLAVTISTLYSRFNTVEVEGSTPRKSTLTYSRIESITSAQIFAGLQLLQVKQRGINVVGIKEDWLDRSISFYLMGAAKAISEHYDCSHHDRNNVMQYLLTKNLKLSDAKALAFISDVDFVDDETIEQNAMGAGTLAAKTWLTKKFIPEDQSLINNLYNWGLIA